MKTAMSEQLTRFYEAALLDLPLAATRRWLGEGPDGLRRAGWAAYDSCVALANEVTNELYANPAVGVAFGRTVETVFHFQHLLDAFTPGIPVALPAPAQHAAHDANVAPAAAPRVTLATRSAHQAEAIAHYRATTGARRSRRAAA